MLVVSELLQTCLVHVPGDDEGEDSEGEDDEDKMKLDSLAHANGLVAPPVAVLNSDWSGSSLLPDVSSPADDNAVRPPPS